MGKGDADILLAQSPTTYAEKIKTPLLIFHGEQDNRTGPVQSDFYTSSSNIWDVIQNMSDTRTPIMRSHAPEM
ncbi:hypothetical protein KUH03_01370 [Sphingobacterium sp. E70]|uniref:alpha/beta hydrolase family protein n=1 Tax=Sphingobacterium sp. E70 TaxID=2853439 RepID=UPI00211C9D6B|nr:hypothetical protein [Sphingobacterium sp. E70]ULT25685.1 hypothetical protein KUH03_01370 [Sphingobacterium sp. E70]